MKSKLKKKRRSHQNATKISMKKATKDIHECIRHRREDKHMISGISVIKSPKYVLRAATLMVWRVKSECMAKAFSTSLNYKVVITCERGSQLCKGKFMSESQ